MPSLGADMEHGKIVEWLVKPGDYVRRGDLVAVVDTDKTVMDVESFQEGVVADFLVDIGETVPVGTPLARITPTPAEVGPPRQEAPPPRPAAAAAAPGPESVPAQATPPIAPPVRHLAHRLGVDTGRIHGTGKNGAITRADVEHAAVAARPAGAGRVRSSPRARRLAAGLGVARSSGSGPGPAGGGPVADVRLAAARQPEAAGAEGPQEPAPEAPAAAAAVPAGELPAAASEPATARERVATLRRAIGALMSRSKQSIPH